MLGLNCSVMYKWAPAAQVEYKMVYKLPTLNELQNGNCRSVNISALVDISLPILHHLHNRLMPTNLSMERTPEKIGRIRIRIHSPDPEAG